MTQTLERDAGRDLLGCFQLARQLEEHSRVAVLSLLPSAAIQSELRRHDVALLRIGQRRIEDFA
jgi:hypothetical protein